MGAAMRAVPRRCQVGAHPRLRHTRLSASPATQITRQLPWVCVGPKQGLGFHRALGLLPPPGRGCKHCQTQHRCPPHLQRARAGPWRYCPDGHDSAIGGCRGPAAATAASPQLQQFERRRTRLPRRTSAAAAAAASEQLWPPPVRCSLRWSAVVPVGAHQPFYIGSARCDSKDAFMKLPSFQHEFSNENAINLKLIFCWPPSPESKI